MHYKNGREAKNGDKIVHIDPYNGTFKTGILYDAKPGNDYCNGKIAVVSSGDACPNLRECIHYEDFVAAIPEEIVKPAK